MQSLSLLVEVFTQVSSVTRQPQREPRVSASQWDKLPTPTLKVESGVHGPELRCWKSHAKRIKTDTFKQSICHVPDSQATCVFFFESYGVKQPELVNDGLMVYINSLSLPYPWVLCFGIGQQAKVHGALDVSGMAFLSFNESLSLREEPAK